MKSNPTEADNKKETRNFLLAALVRFHQPV